MTCLSCGQEVPPGSDGGARLYLPQPGDGAICYRCGWWGVVTEDFSIREPTLGEIVSFYMDEEFSMTLTAVRHHLGR